MSDFLSMGGFANYVWSAYGITAIALVGLAVFSLRANAEAKKQVDRMRPKRRKANAEETA